MRICAAQISSKKGDVRFNIDKHKKYIELAVSEQTDLIVFPELSLTGYEPKLAKKLSTKLKDPRLEIFQHLSDIYEIAIGIGLPIESQQGIFISMIIFKCQQKALAYSKQLLHPDETAYFIPGDNSSIMNVKNEKISFAICYESLQSEHSKKAKEQGADIYIASVAKSQSGINKALSHYSEIAEKYSMPVLMVNSIGYCDDFYSVGQSSAWNEKGKYLGGLDNKNEGILIFDTKTNELIRKV